MENNVLKCVFYPCEATRQLLIAHFSTSSNEAAAVPVLVVQQSKCLQQETIPGICSSLCVFCLRFHHKQMGTSTISASSPTSPAETRMFLTLALITSYPFVSVSFHLSKLLGQRGPKRAVRSEQGSRSGGGKQQQTQTNSTKNSRACGFRSRC